MTKLSLFIPLFILAFATNAMGDLVIAEKGNSRATIMVSSDAEEKVTRAAADLQRYLEKISGVRLPIVTDAENPEGPLILVGRSRLTEGMSIAIPSGLTNARREEGFIILCKGSRLILAGNDEGPYHGTEYAVSEFLYRLGVRWFMPGEFGEVVPRRETISFPDCDIREKPDFVMRNWWLHAKPELAEQERVWKIRNKMNPDSMFQTPTDESARRIMPESLYFKDHPEYFAMNPDGSRNLHLPNLSNPKAVEVAAEIIKQHFQENPDSNSYGFAPDDGWPRDYNPETMSKNRGFVELAGRPGVPGEVSTSEEWITFVNNVAAEVRKEFPDVYIATNGYANRDIPPQGIELNDHLVIMFAAIWSCTTHGYDDPHCWQKVRQGQMLKRWCEMCQNVWVYGYNYQMLVSGLTPIPEVHKLRRDFPLMKKWGVMGFLDESRNVWAESGIASRYLRAQLEWNADANVEDILDDFYIKWYGKAADPMRAFYDALEKAFEKTPMHGHEDRILPEVYSPVLMARLQKCVSSAEGLADTDCTRLHVRADRLIYEHLLAYVQIAEAERAGDFAGAAGYAARMLSLRKELHAVSPFFIWSDESGYHTGVWYWTITDRKKYYQSLADKMSGKTGDLVALLPEKAMFRTDPHDEGIFAEWYKPGLRETGWKPILTTKPFYCQGYEDAEGHPYVGYIWYRLKVDLPESAKGNKVILYAPVVETEGWCWVNGRYIGHRPYTEAYNRPSPMEFDVSKAIRPGDVNEIAIRMSTSLAPAQAAAGLQSRLFLFSPKAVQGESIPVGENGKY